MTSVSEHSRLGRYGCELRKIVALHDTGHNRVQVSSWSHLNCSSCKLFRGTRHKMKPNIGKITRACHFCHTAPGHGEGWGLGCGPVRRPGVTLERRVSLVWPNRPPVLHSTLGNVHSEVDSIWVWCITDESAGVSLPAGLRYCFVVHSVWGRSHLTVCFGHVPCFAA